MFENFQFIYDFFIILSHKQSLITNIFPYIYHTNFILSNCFVSDIDTDELDSDDKNVQVEKVEFLVKEEVTIID